MPFFDVLAKLGKPLTNRQSRVTPAQQAVEVVATNNAPYTGELVVTIPEDPPLDNDERSLLAKGPNSIPITTLTDQFTVKEDGAFFARPNSFQTAHACK